MPFSCGLLAHLKCHDMEGFKGDYVGVRGYNDKFYVSGEDVSSGKVLRKHTEKGDLKPYPKTEDKVIDRIYPSVHDHKF